MTIDEAIKHCEEVAEEKENEGKLLCQSEVASIGCLTCAQEHRQLAEWLRELKQLREQTTWIPVSERLPEHNMSVLIKVRRYDDEIVVRSGYYYAHCSIFHADNGNCWQIDEDGLLAWQPAPKPFEEVEHENCD